MKKCGIIWWDCDL